MTKFLVNFHSQNNEPAVIMKDGEGYAFDGNVERAKDIAGNLHPGLPYEERFEYYQRGSIYGAAYGWVGDTENPEDMERLQQILDDYWATKELENAGDIWEDEGESALDRHDPWNSIIHTTDELAHILELVMFKDWTEAHLPGSDKLAPLLESGFPPFGDQSLLPLIPAVCLGDFLLPSVNEGDSVPEWFCVGNWRTKRDLDSEILYDGFARWRYKLLASRGSGKEQVLDPLSDEFGNFWIFGPEFGQAGNAWGLVARIGSLIVDLRWHVPLLDDGQWDLAVSNQVIRIWNELIWTRLEWFGDNALEASHWDDVPSRTRTTPFVMVTWCDYDERAGLFIHDPVAPDDEDSTPADMSAVPDREALEVAVVLLDLLPKLSQTSPGEELSPAYEDWRSLSASLASNENLRYYDKEALYLLSEALESSLTEWFGASEAGHGPVPVIPMRCLGDFRNKSRAEWWELFEDQWCPWDWRTRQGLELAACYYGLPFWQDEMLKGDHQLQDLLSSDTGDFWMFGQSYANMAGAVHGLMARMGSFVVDLRWFGASEGAVVIDAWNRMFEEKIITSSEQEDYSGELKGSPFVLVVWDSFREVSGVYANAEPLASNERALEIAFSLIDALPPQPGVNPLPVGDWEEGTTSWRRLTRPPTPNESNDAP